MKKHKKNQLNNLITLIYEKLSEDPQILSKNLTDMTAKTEIELMDGILKEGNPKESIKSLLSIWIDRLQLFEDENFIKYCSAWKADLYQKTIKSLNNNYKDNLSELRQIWIENIRSRM